MQVTEVPEGLAAMPAGAALASALHAVELAAVPNDRILDVLRAQYRQLCHEQARMAAVLAELGRCPAVPGPGVVARDEAPGRFAPAESRAALRWTRRAADTEHDLADTVVHHMPALFSAWLAGAVDRPRVRVFDTYLTGLNPEQIDRICAVAVPRAPKLTTGQLAHLLRRMVIAVDPGAAARWYRQGVRDRNVTAYPAPDGTITLSANGLPADEAEAACQRIEHLAAAAKRAGHPGRIGQIRCDLFLGLLDGRFHSMTTDQVITVLITDHATSDGSTGDHGPGDGGPDPEPGDPEPGDGEPGGPPVPGPTDTGPTGTRPSGTGPDQRIGIEIRIALSTLLGHDEHPAEIPGLGLLVAPDARLRVALQRRSEWRFAVTAADGTLISEGRTRKRPLGTRRDGPPGGIVELHIPATLLHHLAADPESCGAWAAVIADIAAQHADRGSHLADLDSRPRDRLPGTAPRRHTEIRDRTCTFAGVCRRPAHDGHIDHSRDHAMGGPTTRINLGPLCGQDHAVKHRAGWTVTQPEHGTFVWHSPLGGHYPARGEFLLPELPEPAPADPSPGPDLPRRTVEGPILRRPPPAGSVPAPATPVDSPDEPPF